VEFIKYHMDTADPMMQGLTSIGEGPYGAPLTTCAPVWGKESNATNLQILHEDFWLKRNIQEALTAIEDPGLLREVTRYWGLLKQGIDLCHHEMHIDQALEVHIWNMKQCWRHLFASCFHDHLWPIVCSDRPKLHVLPDALHPNSPPIVIPNPELWGRSTTSAGAARIHGGAGSPDRQACHGHKGAKKNSPKHYKHFPSNWRCKFCRATGHMDDYCYIPHTNCPCGGTCLVRWAH
jgi:hypothetical protein